MIPSDSADCGRQFRLATPPRARPVGVLSLASIASTSTHTHTLVEIVLPASLRNRRERDNHLLALPKILTFMQERGRG
jgi:hypothetical protein